MLLAFTSCCLQRSLTIQYFFYSYKLTTGKSFKTQFSREEMTYKNMFLWALFLVMCFLVMLFLLGKGMSSFGETHINSAFQK